MKIWTFGMVVGSLLVSPAVATSAEITVGQYLQMVDKDPALANIIGVAGESFLFANGRLNARGQPGLYCQPPKLSITTEQYVVILKNYVNSPKHLSAKVNIESMPFVMLQALEEAFPCTQ
jgi:hypothetical protein